MRHALLLAALLAASPAGAASLKLVSAQGGGAGPAMGAWAGALAPTLHAMRDMPRPPEGPDLPGLSSWGLEKPENAPRLAPLVEALEALESGPRTPEGFSALPEAERTHSLEKAMTLAGRAASAEVEAIRALVEREDAKGAEFLLRRAQKAGEAFAPYLSAARKDQLGALMQAVKEAVAAEKEGRVSRRLQAVRGGLEEGTREDAEPLPVGVPTAPAWAKAALLKAPEAPSRPVERRFTLSRARSDEGPLDRVRAAREFALRRAAASGRAGAFWEAADEAVEALELEFMKDDLSLIAEHSLGPWAEARLSSYELQLRSLWRLILDIKAQKGIGPRPAQSIGYARDVPVVESRHADSETYDRVMGSLRRVRERDGERAERDGASLAAKAVELKALGADPGARAARPLVELVRHHERVLADAERNPDPAVAAGVRRALADPFDRRTESPAGLRRAWRLAMFDGALERLGSRETRLFVASAALALLAGGLAAAGLSFGYSFALLSVSGILAAMGADLRSLKKSFGTLGERLDRLTGK